LHEGCFLNPQKLQTLDLATDDEEILLNHHCKCDNPNFCSCGDSSETDSDFQFSKHKEKLKVCMYHNTRDQDAQMLAQIKALPEGDMKKSLLESFLKTMTHEQKQGKPESSHTT
jgi:hypothetical protein